MCLTEHYALTLISSSWLEGTQATAPLPTLCLLCSLVQSIIMVTHTGCGKAIVCVLPQSSVPSVLLVCVQHS